ncbi:g6750 [Coccomyxa elongata]
MGIYHLRSGNGSPTFTLQVVTDGAQFMAELNVWMAKLAAEQRQTLMHWLRQLGSGQFKARNVRTLQRRISGLASRQMSSWSMLEEKCTSCST